MDNTLKNLALLGKILALTFVPPSGYDKSTLNTLLKKHHGRAVVVNFKYITVAFVGCVIATILGLFVGILRLSKLL